MFHIQVDRVVDGDRRFCDFEFVSFDEVCSFLKFIDNCIGFDCITIDHFSMEVSLNEEESSE